MGMKIMLPGLILAIKVATCGFNVATKIYLYFSLNSFDKNFGWDFGKLIPMAFLIGSL